jgi:hypothetical protein
MFSGVGRAVRSSRVAGPWLYAAVRIFSRVTVEFFVLKVSAVPPEASEPAYLRFGIVALGEGLCDGRWSRAPELIMRRAAQARRTRRVVLRGHARE